MSLKDDFSQAVKDILKKGDIVNKGNNESEASAKSELDRYLEPSTFSENNENANGNSSNMNSAKSTSSNFNSTTSKTLASENAATERAESTYQQSSRDSDYRRAQDEKDKAFFERDDKPLSSDDEMTVISRNTIIEGNVRSFANVNIEGSVRGDIMITKNASVSGKLVGNLDCNNAAMSGSQIQGDVTSKGQIKFDRDSLILGNISASYLEMNGKVKGNIDINGKAEFQSDAYILGDINVSTLAVAEGATISGHVTTTFLQESPSSVFPEMISMGEIG